MNKHFAKDRAQKPRSIVISKQKYKLKPLVCHKHQVGQMTELTALSTTKTQSNDMLIPCWRVKCDTHALEKNGSI